MVLENVKEMWTEKPKGSKGKGVNKDRFVSKMYVLPRFGGCYKYLQSCDTLCGFPYAVNVGRLTSSVQVPSWRLCHPRPAQLSSSIAMLILHLPIPSPAPKVLISV